MRRPPPLLAGVFASIAWGAGVSASAQQGRHCPVSGPEPVLATWTVETSSAAEAPETLPETLNGILAAVLARHPAFRVSEARALAGRELSRDLRQPLNPDVQVDLGGSGPFGEVVAGAEVSVPLRPRGEVAAIRRSGAADVAVIAAECLVAGADLLYEAASAYADFLAAEDQVALAEQELEIARGFETHARRRADLAMAGDLPVLQARILAEEAIGRRDDAAGQVRAAQARLSVLSGDTAAAAPAAAGPVTAPASPDPARRAAEWGRLTSLPPGAGRADRRLVHAGVPTGSMPGGVRGPALAAARARAEAARLEVARARVSRRIAPRVGLRAERDTGGEFKLFALAGLAVPLFNRGTHLVAAAAAAAEAARWQVAADSLALAADLAAALAQHGVARAGLERLEGETLPRAVRLEAAARRNTEQGMAGFVLWLQARRSLLDLRTREIELRRRLAASALAARRVTGDFDLLLGGDG